MDNLARPLRVVATGQYLHQIGEGLHGGLHGVAGVAQLLPSHLIHLLDLEEHEMEQVEHFKYKQDLERKLTTVSIIGLGFLLMGVPYGLSLTLWISLVDGGNVTLLYGWIIVAVFLIMVVLLLLELAARYPTAGGVYHFSAVLGGSKYSLISSWIAGWFLVIGNWCYLVLIMYLGLEFILLILGLKDAYYKEDVIYVLIVYFALLISCGLVNYKFQNWLELINRICIYWLVGAVVIIDILLLIFAKRTNSIGHILSGFDNSRSGWPAPIAFLVGLQASAFTMTGYGMLFSMTDEVKKPERTMPRGALAATGLAGLTGIIFILPLLTILPKLKVILDDNPEVMPIDIVFKAATELYIVSFILALLLVGTVLFQLIGSLTTASRNTYAFARDGALPFNNLWTEVEEKVPKNALYLSMLVCAVLSLLLLISRAAFNAFMGAAVISLLLANAVPIFLLMVNGRKKVKGSPFRLPKWIGWTVNGLALTWLILLLIILCFPPVIKGLNGSNMNYSSAVFTIMAGVATAGFKLWGSGTFTGPQVDTDYFELHSRAPQFEDEFAIRDDEEDEHSGMELIYDDDADQRAGDYNYDNNYESDGTRGSGQAYHPLKKDHHQAEDEGEDEEATQTSFDKDTHIPSYKLDL